MESVNSVGENYCEFEEIKGDDGEGNQSVNTLNDIRTELMSKGLMTNELEEFFDEYENEDTEGLLERGPASSEVCANGSQPAQKINESEMIERFRIIWLQCEGGSQFEG
jgi:hypothetical protein